MPLHPILQPHYIRAKREREAPEETSQHCNGQAELTWHPWHPWKSNKALNGEEQGHKRLLRPVT